MTTVLFACVHNAGRSHMAAALFNRLADPPRARATSAGANHGTRVHPEVIEAMRELGTDLSAATAPLVLLVLLLGSCCCQRYRCPNSRSGAAYFRRSRRILRMKAVPPARVDGS